MVSDGIMSRRIWVIRLLMIIGIIFIHIPFGGSQSVSKVFNLFSSFITDGVFRAAVPVLTTLSGYLLFISSSDQRAYQLISKKINTLLVPLILWNLPMIVVVYSLQRFDLLGHVFSEQLYPFNTRAWMDGLLGLTKAPVNYPLNFIRDLFAISMLAPFLGLLLRRLPYIGFLGVIFVYWFNLDGLYIIRESMLVSFYLGGLIAIQKWDVITLDKFAWILLPVFLGCAFYISFFEIEKIDLFRIVSPFMVWPIMRLIVPTSFGDFLYRNSRHSFFIYLACGPLLFIMWFLYSRYLNAVAYEIFWFSSPVIIVVICILLSRYLRRWLPGVSRVLLGDR